MKKIVILITALIMASPGYSQSAKAVAYNNEGTEKFNQKDFSGAIENFTRAIKIDPEFALAFDNRGYAKQSLGQYEEAIKDYDQAIAIDPKVAQYFNRRGNAKHYLKQYKEAIKDYDQAIIIDPKFARAYTNRGNSLLSLSQYEEAIKDCDQAIAIDPKFADAYRVRGVAKDDLGQYEEAIKDYDQAIAIYPKYANAYLFRGSAKRNLGQDEEAIKDYDQAIAINPKYANAYLYRGIVKRSLGQDEEAIKDYDQAIIIDPKFANAYLDRGVVKRNSGQYEEAIKDFDQAIAIDPKMIQVYYQFGKCYYKLNNAVRANEYFNKYLSLVDSKSDVTCFAKVYLGQKDIAFSEMEEIVKKTPSKGYYYQLATLYAVAGETESAIKNLDIALSKGYNSYNFMQTDDNLEFIRYKPGYIDLLKKYNIVNINTNTVLSKIITSEVKAAILKWQEKTEFETNIAYAERMKTRDDKVKRVTMEVTNQLKKEVLQKINWNIARIGKYDSEGQTFMITFEGINSIVVYVPLADAPSFKSNYQSYKITKKDLVISNERWVISELVCSDPSGTKSYKYDIKNQPDYNPNQIFSLNFDALNIKVDQYDVAQSQKQTGSKTIVIGKDPVDIDIPVNSSTNSTTFALIIGNETYRNEINVPFAINDASVFSEYCKKTFGLPANNVHVVKDATYGQMLGEIKWLQDVLKAYNGKAKAIFYYAGHGMPDEKDKSAYLLPVDGNSEITATAVKVDELYTNLSGIPNAGVLVFLDACFSGAAREGTLAQGRGVRIQPKESILKENIIVFSATSGEETALPLKEKGHGLFTYYLLKKLQESKGDVSLLELTEYVSNEVKQQSIVVNNKSQNPKVNMSEDMEGKWQSLKIK